MKLSDRRLWLGGLLVVWAFVLWSQFFQGTSEALDEPEVTPAQPHIPGVSDTDSGSRMEAVDPVAPPEVVVAQKAVIGQPFDRDPFVKSSMARELGYEEVELTSIIGRFAIINGERYRVGDTVPGLGELLRLERKGIVVRTSRGELNISIRKKRRSSRSDREFRDDARPQE